MCIRDSALGERAYYTAQFSNPCNADAHLNGTGPELWRQCGGRLDAVVLGAGTGGPASGITRALRSLASQSGVEPPRIIVVEPELSRTLSGGVHHNGHGVTGIGAGVPLAFVCNKDEQDEGQRVQVDEFRSCSLADALDEARAVSMRDGVLAGPSSGAAPPPAEGRARPQVEKDSPGWPRDRAARGGCDGNGACQREPESHWFLQLTRCGRD